jgi:hypothetical protein
VDAEVRMTLYQAVLRLDAYRDSVGFYPEGLEAVFEGPEDLEGLRYERLDPARFHLFATRGAASAMYQTGDSLSAVLGDAVRVLERVRP